MTTWEIILCEILAVIGYTFFVILCGMYANIFLTRRKFKNKKWEYGVAFGIVMGLDIALHVWGEMIPVKLIFMIIISFLYVWIMYEHHLLKIFFCVIMHFTIVAVIDYIWPIVLSIFIPSITWQVVYDSVGAPIMSVTAHLFHFLILKFVKKYALQEYSGGLSKIEWIYFSVFPVVTFVIFVLINSVFGFVEDQIQKKIVTILALGLLTMNVAVFFLVKNILKRETKIRESNLFMERVKNETIMYRNTSKDYSMQRKREHEYKNQIAIIAALVHDNKIEELKRYLAEYNKGNIIRTNAIDTHNVIVNAIVNSKYQEMKEKKIVFTVKVNDLSRLHIQDEDVVLILSNLLNNAIEACEKCENGVVRLKFMEEQDGILISVVNTMLVPPIVEGKTYVTTKVDHKEMHGIGIGNIKETVKRYGGYCVIKHDEAAFYFTIFIPRET